MSDPDWIEHSGIKSGGLHKTLGIAAGKKIPAKKIAQAERSSNPKEEKEGVLAATFRKMAP